MGGNWTGQWQGKWEGRLIGPIDPNFLSGVASFQLSALGSAFGVGAVQGGAYVQFSAVGEIESGVLPSYVSGSSSITFGASATLVGALLASGSASVVFDASGNGYLAVNAAGAADIDFGTSGAITGKGFATGLSSISVSGGAVLSGIGRLSGQSDILITPTGDIFSPLWTSGETGIALGITGQINGALWVVGESDIALQASGLLTGIGSISGVAWTILNARHVDLTGYQRAYVRSILESVYTSTETDQIIFTAARNAISVLDAAVALRINAEPLQIIAAQERKRRAPQPVVEKQAIQPKTQERKNNPAYVVATPQTTYAQSGDAPLFAISETQQLVAATASKPIFINLRTKE